MKTIIAAVDFTNDSLNAVNYAADMASTTGCNLLIVHVCAYPLVVADAPLSLYTIELMVEDAEKKLADLKELIITRTAGQVKITTLVKQGDVVEGIKECCTSHNTYAVVMGRNNASAIERLLFGATIVSALKKFDCPLVTVPPGASFKGIRNIGLACDFREVIETLPAEEIKSIVRELKAKLHVLHVSQDPEQALSEKTIEESGWFQDLMGDLRPNYHFIQGVDAEDEIIDYANKHQLDLLIIIPKKHDLWKKIFQHSHSSQLVLHADIPVMAIHE